MNIGLLWFDDSPKRTLPEKLHLARAAYRARFGVEPVECQVNATMLPTGAASGYVVDGLRLVVSRYRQDGEMYLIHGTAGETK